MCLVLSPPTLEPRCPLHLPPPPQTYRMTVELGDAISLGVLLQDNFAISWPRVGTWLCTLHPSLALPSGVQGQKAQAGRELHSARADPTAKHSQARMLHALGTETSVALVETAPLCPGCPCRL